MKCPKCGGNLETVVTQTRRAGVTIRDCCFNAGICRYRSEPRKLIDPVLMLELIEKVFDKIPWTNAIWEGGLEDVLNAVVSYLQGNRDALEELGKEEP